MATKLEKIASELNAKYRDDFDRAFLENFGVLVSTGFNIMSMSLISTRDDGKKLTKQQALWAKAYGDGYGDALQRVRGAANR